MELENARRRYESGFASLENGRIIEAIALWTPLLHANISPPDYLRVMALRLMQRAQRDPVAWTFIVKAAEAARQRGLDDGDTLRLLAWGYLLTDRKAEGAEIANLLVARHPHDWRSWKIKASASPRGEAVPHLQTALALQPFPDDRVGIDLLNDLGEAHLARGEAGQARAVARLLARFPAGPWREPALTMGLYLEFQALVSTGDLDAAEALTRTILAAISVPADPLTEIPHGCDRGLIYIHIPKTGGSSINKAIIGLDALNAKHRYLTNGPPRFDPYYSMSTPSALSLPTVANGNSRIFSSVRNIYAFLFSYYNWVRRGPGSWTPHSVWAIRWDFEGWLSHVAESDEAWVSNGFVFFQLFEELSGALVVDWILRTESLQEDLNAMCAAWGLAAPAVPHENRGAHGDYRQHYTPRMIDLIEKTWADDIQLFGFDFENGYRATAPLHRDVAAMKGRVRYDRVTRRVRLADAPDDPDLIPLGAG
ncbi:MAG: hypothetical protein HQL38_03840 [Alphaproteobacteria bacterium]|nr:hypothetical protein [Alphaproteobacteria bacterium]